MSFLPIKFQNTRYLFKHYCILLMMLSFGAKAEITGEGTGHETHKFYYPDYDTAYAACVDWGLSQGSTIWCGPSSAPYLETGWYRDSNNTFHFGQFYYDISCNFGEVVDEFSGCQERSSEDDGSPNCKAGKVGKGNPIVLSNGNKYETTTDIHFQGSKLKWQRHYNSRQKGWRMGYSQGLTFNSTELQLQRRGTVDVTHADGSRSRFIESFTPDGQQIYLSQQSNYSLSNSSSWLSSYMLKNTKGETEYYSGMPEGKLLRIEYPQGGFLSFETGSDGFNVIRDHLGNYIRYLGTNNYTISRVESSDGSVFDYQYDQSGNLSKVILNSELDSEHLYENLAFPHALTGTIDARGRRYATWGYDDAGRANYSAHGQYDGSSRKEETKIEYLPGSVVKVTNAYGKTSQYYHTHKNGANKVSEIVGDASLNCDASAAYNTYDANGSKDTVTDNKGNVTDYDYNQYGLIESVTEGLQWQDPNTQTTLITTPSTRTTTTQWVLDTRQKDIVTTESLITDYDYYPNNRIQSITQTDTTTHTTPLGSTNGRQKVWTYTYTYHTVAGVAADVIVNEETLDGPLPGSADITINKYDVAGNLISITNALGQVTTFADFNGRGQAQTMTDINGVVTKLTFHPRGWLTTVTVKSPDGNAFNASVNQYDYYANGTLQRLTQADGSYLEYAYNDARHLTSITNNLGESITYTPNTEGKWTLAQTKDSGGIIKRQQQRAFDELGRVMDLLGENNQHTKLRYDKNNNPVDTIEYGASTTPQTTRTYDSLDRLKTMIDPDSNTATYDYDAQNNLTGVTDQKGVQTQYTYDGFNQLIQQSSPDSGTTFYWYDEAGNLTQKQDARSIETVYIYDALSRLTNQNFPTSANENISYTYDGTAQGENGLGRLTHVADPSGSTHYYYDHMGRVVRVDVQISGVSHSIQYDYDLNGHLTSTTYPSGLIVSYERDTLGRIQNVVTDSAGQITALVSAIQYYPFGPNSQMNLGNGLVQTAVYDSDYRLSALQLTESFTSIQNILYDFDWFNNITGLTDADGLLRQQSFSYDLQHRIDVATDNLATSQGGYVSQDFDYDPVGNRTLLTTPNDQTTYTYPLDSNRLASNSWWDYEYDAVGNTTRQYDADGNQLVFAYNHRNRLSAVTKDSVTSTKVKGKWVYTTVSTQTNYEYNALGQRVIKSSDSADVYYLFNLQGQVIAEADSLGNIQIEYVYLDGQPLAQISTNEITTGGTLNLTLDNTVSSTTGNWTLKSNRKALNSDYLQASGGTNSTATWQPTLAAGSYAVSARWISNRSNSTQVPYTIYHNGQTDTVYVDQTANNGKWIQLGTFDFDGSGVESIQVSDSNGQTSVDGIQLLEQSVTQLETQLQYIHNDHLGTPQRMTNASGDVVWEALYEPFGAAIVNEDVDGDGQSVALNLRFPGQYFDVETGLHYNYFRDYDPSTGRYVQSDSIGVTLDYSDPQRQIAAQMGVAIPNVSGIKNLNHVYGYVNQNPIRYVDLTGEFAICLAGPGGALACAAAAIAAAAGITQCSDKVENYCEQQYPNWASDPIQYRGYITCNANIHGATGAAVGAASDGIGTTATEAGGAIGDALSN